MNNVDIVNRKIGKEVEEMWSLVKRDRIQKTLVAARHFFPGSEITTYHAY